MVNCGLLRPWLDLAYSDASESSRVWGQAEFWARTRFKKARDAVVNLCRWIQNEDKIFARIHAPTGADMKCMPKVTIKLVVAHPTFSRVPPFSKSRTN